MTEERDELVELASEIKRVIADNRKFLERVLEEDFEPEEEEIADEEVHEEL